MAAGNERQTLKSQFVRDPLTDRDEIFIVASGHHWKPEKAIHFRFGGKFKMAAGNERQILKSQYIGDRLTDHYKIFTEASFQHGTQSRPI